MQKKTNGKKKVQQHGSDSRQGTHTSTESEMKATLSQPTLELLNLAHALLIHTISLELLIVIKLTMCYFNEKRQVLKLSKYIFHADDVMLIELERKQHLLITIKIRNVRKLVLLWLKKQQFLTFTQTTGESGIQNKSSGSKMELKRTKV